MYTYIYIYIYIYIYVVFIYLFTCDGNHFIFLRIHFIICRPCLFPSLVPAQPRHDEQRLLLRGHHDQAAEDHVLGSQNQSDHVQAQGPNPRRRQLEVPGQLGRAAAAERDLEQRLRGSHVLDMYIIVIIIIMIIIIYIYNNNNNNYYYYY